MKEAYKLFPGRTASTPRYVNNTRNSQTATLIQQDQTKTLPIWVLVPREKKLDGKYPDINS